MQVMAFQDFPFNGDRYMEGEFLNLKKKYSIDIVFETGSCMYVTTEWLAKNFDQVYTFEINKDYADYGMHRLIGLTNVVTLIKDSVEGLKMLLPLVTERNVMVYLDAHWLNHCPLLEEIQTLTLLKTKQPPVIVIHDFKTENPELGYDSYHGQPFTYDWIKPSIDKLNEHFTDYEYEHYYNTEAIGAKRGVIYLTPKKKQNELAEEIQ